MVAMFSWQSMKPISRLRLVIWSPDGHLYYLYCHPDHIRQGAASALYDQLEITAQKLTLAEIYVEASEAALMFFRYKGFATTQRRDFDIDGVKIHNYAMRKGLKP